jgi:hypothetical protein
MPTTTRGQMSGAPRRSFAGWIGHKLRRQLRHGSVRAWAKHAIEANTGRRYKLDYFADGLGVRGKNLSFLDEPTFAAAWAMSHSLNAEGLGRQCAGHSLARPCGVLGGRACALP